MFEFTRNFYAYNPAEGGGEGGSEPSFTPGQIIIPEQSVTVSQSNAQLQGITIDTTPPEKLLISFDNNSYEVPCKNQGPGVFAYGDSVPGTGAIFDRYPFFITIFVGAPGVIETPEPGTYTISAKVPGTVPKVLSFPKGRTIVSELSRINKAFGTVSTKKTIIGQLSDIADAAEAGKIGGGGGGTPLIINVSEANGGYIMDKTAGEVLSAARTTGAIAYFGNNTAAQIISAEFSPKSGEFGFVVAEGYNWQPAPFVASSENDYPLSN